MLVPLTKVAHLDVTGYELLLPLDRSSNVDIDDGLGEPT